MQRLSTVSFCTSVPLHKKGETTVMLDTIQTYFDMTEEKIKGLIAKFPGLHFDVEKQTRELGKKPKIETSESLLAIKRFPTVPREDLKKFEGATSKVVSKISFVPEKPAPKVETIKPNTGSYGELVNVMLEKTA